MPSPAAVECPACLATLKVPEDKLGKKIRCPKCSEVFVAEASEEVEDFEPEEERRPARGKGPVKKGGKKSGSGLLIGGIAGGVALIAVAGVVIFLMTSGGGGGGAAAPQAAQTMPPAGMAPAATPSADPAAMAAAMGAHGGTMPGAAHAAPPAAAPAATTGSSATPASAPQPAVAPAASFVSQSSSGPAKLDLSWIPAETELMINLRPAAIWSAPALQQALKQPLVFLGVGQMQAMTGITPADIDSLTIAMRLPDAKAPAAAAPAGVALSPGAEMPEIANVQPVIVARLKKPLLDSVWERPDLPLQVANYAGQTVRKFSPPAANGKQLTFAIHQPNELTIVAGLEGTVQALIDAKGDAKLFADWAPLDSNLQLQVAGRPKNLGPQWEAARRNGPPADAEQQRLQETLEKHARAFAVGLQFTDGIELALRMQADSEAGGRALEEALKPQLTKAHAEFAAGFEKGFEQTGGPAPPEVKSLVATVQENSAFSQQGAVSSLTSRIPADKMVLFAQLAQKAQQNPMAGMMLGGMVPGGPSGFPGRPGGMPTGERTGQTEPMATQTPEALPAGLELQASTLWDAPQPGSAGVPLLMQFRVTGADDAILCAAGEFELKPPTTDSGKSLTGIPPRQTTLSAPEQILRTYLVPLDPPEDGAANVATFHLAFKGPDEKARALASCEGKFRIVRAKSQTDFQVPLKKPLPAKLDLPDELKAAGLTVKLERTKPGSGPVADELVVAVGPAALVARLQVLDADGSGPASGWESPVVRYVREKGGLVQRLSSESGDKLPDSFQLGLVLFDGAEVLTVPFRFNDLPLPDPSSRPVMAAPPQFRGGPLPGGPFPGGGPVPPGGPIPGGAAPPAAPGAVPANPGAADSSAANPGGGAQPRP